MESANGRIVVQAAGNDETYEIELDSVSGRITMKEVVAEYDLNDFMQESTHLSQLKEGDLFRMDGDCVVWRCYKAEERYGQLSYGFIRENGREISWLTSDVKVYPCGE